LLVKFREMDKPFILYQKEYADVLPLLEMIKKQGEFSFFFDSNGDRRIFGRFHDYQYMIEISAGRVFETLTVELDCSEISL